MSATLWTPADADFPERLTTISSAPKRLYVLGDRRVMDRPCVAIVGTRQPSSYGARVARQLASALAERGVCIVSGLALGIDAIAHRAALEVGGATVAVLGAGIDVVYPPGHTALYADVIARGAVVSEFGAGQGIFRGCFPRRNRIIAGLSCLTIVVEAGHKSGALVTATLAADMGRVVAAVPGPIDTPQSQGTNQLLRDGAHVIASVDDAIMLVGLAMPSGADAARAASTERDVAMTDDERVVWQAIPRAKPSRRVQAKSANVEGAGILADDLVTETALPPHRCLAALTGLELRGLVRCSSVGRVSRV